MKSLPNGALTLSWKRLDCVGLLAELGEPDQARLAVLSTYT